MTSAEEEFDHRVHAWLSDQLSAQLADAPEHLPIGVMIAEVPGGGWVADELVATAVAVSAPGADQHVEISCDFPSGQYYRRTPQDQEELFDHVAKAWTAGQLRTALANIPVAVGIIVTFPGRPGDTLLEEQVVVSAGPHTAADGKPYFEIACEFPAGRYDRRSTWR